MARSHYYNKQKLNEYIQESVKTRTEKYYNFTHQKLTEEEEQIKKKIQEESTVIKQCEQNIKKTKEVENKYSEKKRLAEIEIQSEEKKKRDIAEKDSAIALPIEPNTKNLLNGRNIICFILAGFVAFAFSQDIAEGIGFILFMPGFFVLFKVIAYWVLKNEDEREWAKYFNERNEYNQKIDNKFVPSYQYKENQETVKKIDSLLFNAKEVVTNEYKLISAKKFEIVLLKKIIIELKRFKKRASERERTAKINAFEKKNRSGSQNIKDKLLKEVRIKSNWNCPYCANQSDVNLAEADHIHPVNKGGLTTLQNMVLICKKCNSKKTNLMLRVFCKKQSYDYNEVCNRLERIGKDV